MTALQKSHLNGNFADVGYHFAIDGYGKIYEGREIGYMGAHVSDANENAIGIVLMGNFETTATGLGTLYKGHLLRHRQLTRSSH